jgi:two-component system sensor histidine kinase/response regulator
VDTFSFSHTQPTQPQQPADGVTAAPAGRSSVRLLVVEDNGVNQRLAVLQLQRLGYAADVASDGQEALSRLDRYPYALVFMDVHMPNMDGFEASQVIRAGERLTGHHIPIIAMTADALEGDRELCLSAGMDDYVAKPVTLDSLRSVLTRWLPRSTAGVEAHAASDPLQQPPTSAASVWSPDWTPRVSEQREPAPAPPAASPSGAARTATPRGAWTPPPMPSGGRADTKILLVDDNVVNQKLTSLQLQRLGYGVDIAGDGREALEMLARRSYALVLMDCNMPVMDGYEATRAIRAKEQATGGHIPIIAVTANALSGDKERCLDAGMDAYLAKPVKLQALQQAVEHWLADAPPPAQPTATPAAMPVAAPSVPTPAATVPAPERSWLAGPQDLDLSQIDAIRTLQSADAPEVLGEVLAEFRQESAQILAQLRRALQAGDTRTMYRAAHSWKSSAAYIGAHALSGLCAELEQLCKTDSGPAVMGRAVEVMRQIEDAYMRVLIALDRLHSAPLRAASDSGGLSGWHAGPA